MKDDILDEIFSMQRGLTDAMDLSRYPDDTQERISNLCTAIMHEAVELQRTTNWKWWKTPVTFDTDICTFRHEACGYGTAPLGSTGFEIGDSNPGTLQRLYPRRKIANKVTFDTERKNRSTLTQNS